MAARHDWSLIPRWRITLLIALAPIRVSAADASCEAGPANQQKISLLQKQTASSKITYDVFPDTMNIELQAIDKERCDLKELPVSTEPPKSFENFNHGRTYDGLYVNKDAKFAFCLIEKNACSAWSAILSRLETGNLDAGRNYQLIKNTFKAEDATEVFQDPAATRAVFVRDPLERFLSAFLDKCVSSGNCSNAYCYMRRQDQNGSSIPFSQAIEWLKQRNTTTMDGHWGLQSQHCELQSRLHEYTIMGVMKSGTLGDNAACLLERAGLLHLNVQGTSNSNAFWQVMSDIESKEKDTKTREYLMSFYTKEAAETVYNAYKEDYDLFQLPRPTWIDEAHGSLYEDTQATKCFPVTSLVAKDAAAPQTGPGHAVGIAIDNDDISTLAGRQAESYSYNFRQSLLQLLGEHWKPLVDAGTRHLSTPATLHSPKMSALELQSEKGDKHHAHKKHVQSPTKRCLVVTELADTGRHKRQFLALFHPSWKLMTNATIPEDRHELCTVDLMTWCEPKACGILPKDCQEVHLGDAPSGKGSAQCYYQVLSDTFADHKYRYALSLNFMTTGDFEKAVRPYDYVMRSDVDALLGVGLRTWLPDFGSAVGNGFMGSKYTHKRLEQVAKNLSYNHYGIHNMQSTFYVRASKIVPFSQMIVNLSQYFYENEFTPEKCVDVEHEDRPRGNCTWPDWYPLVSTLYATDLAANHILGEPEYKAEQVTQRLDHGATEYWRPEWGDHGDLWMSPWRAADVAQVHLLAAKRHIGQGFLEENSGESEKFCKLANETWTNYSVTKPHDWGNGAESISTFFMRVLDNSIPGMCSQMPLF